ncbi:hypothetical protein NDU88_001676 [Pleurodeles waltl]|uniref:Endonuclease/exonuclease/phosphatase domain-containing protein n=1 Tax=Pleurodeles waltl TaxID=8319 RepID=A0AAV7MM80_PLEWA|nr:hypothetical protein NDU88_001676 [Pleurodeles waltl]
MASMPASNGPLPLEATACPAAHDSPCLRHSTDSGVPHGTNPDNKALGRCGLHVHCGNYYSGYRVQTRCGWKVKEGNMYDYNIQRGLFEEDLELLCIGKAGYLTLMLGDFNLKLDLNSSDNLYMQLLVAAQIPNSIFLNIECSDSDLSLVRTIGSLDMFCLNGRMKMDRPAKWTFRIGNQVCPIDYAFVNTWSFGEVLEIEVEHIEGSDHWPLRLTIRSADKTQKEREKALIALVEYSRRIMTRLIE